MKRTSFFGVLKDLVGLHRTVQFDFFSITGKGIDFDYCDIEWFALETNWDLSVVFETAPKYCILDSFFDCEGYSISSKGFLPTVVDIIVIWIKFAHSHHFSSLTKMLMFTLAISCLTMCNLPWFMDLMFQVPTQHCFLQHWTLLSPPDTPTTEHCFCFGPATSFFLQLFVIALHSSPVTYGTPSNMQWGVWRGKRRGSIVSLRTEYRVHKLGDWSPSEVRVKWTWTARKFQGFPW